MPGRRELTEQDNFGGRAVAVLPPEFIVAAARLYAHPRFRPAVSQYCQRMAGEKPMAWPIFKVFDQFDRYFVSYMLIHNYFAWRFAGGAQPTLSALEKMTTSSPRQTAGFIAALKAGQLVRAGADPVDHRVKLLKPAPAMVAEIGRSVRLFVAAADEIAGRGPDRSALLDDTDRLGDLLRRSAASVLANGTLIHSFPRVLHFAARDCGYPLLTAVMAAFYTGAAAPSRKALAQRFQVSPAHIGNLIADAQDRGWFRLGPGGYLQDVSDELVVEFEQWASWQMVHFDGLAAETAAFFDARPAGTEGQAAAGFF